MSRQAVSKQISRLEEELDTRLFVRGTRRVELTEAGKGYFRLFSELARGLKELRGIYSLTRKDNGLRVGYLAGVDLHPALNGIMSEMLRVMPGLDIKWERHDPNTLLDRLNSGELDAAISYGGIPREGSPWVRDFRLANRDTLLCVSQWHPKAKPGASPKDFEDETLFGWVRGSDLEAERQKLFENAGRQGIRIKRVKVVENRDSAHAAVEMGEGIAICSDISDICRNPAVITYKLEHPSPLHIFWRSGREKEGITEFLECVGRNRQAFAFENK